MAWAAAYGAALLAMGVLDALWLGVIASDLYQREIGHLLAAEVNKTAAVLFYLGYPACLLGLALQPEPGSLRTVLWRSALFGLLAYGTYDFTNMATLRGWPWKIVLIDLAWGVFITSAAGWAAHAGYRAARRGR